MLVVHRGDHAALAFDQVNASDCAQGCAREQNGAGVDGFRSVVFLLGVGGLAGRTGGQLSGRTVHPAVLEAPLDGIDTVVELALYPFQVGQAGAIGVLVEHPGGDQVRSCAGERLCLLTGGRWFRLQGFIHHHLPHSH